jgi:hypothetical protein
MSLQPGAITPPVKQGKGCLFYGCASALVISVVLIIGIYFGARYVFNKVVDEYTQAAPVALPPLDNSTESYLKVKGRVEAFQSAVRNGEPSTLELTAPEINTYLSSHPGLEGVTEYFRITLEGNILKCLLSVPLDQMGVESRYLNGVASVSVAMENGKPYAEMKEMRVGDKALPDEAIKQFSSKNLFDQADPKIQEKITEILLGVDSLVVENSILRLNGGSKHQ